MGAEPVDGADVVHGDGFIGDVGVEAKEARLRELPAGGHALLFLRRAQQFIQHPLDPAPQRARLADRLAEAAGAERDDRGGLGRVLAGVAEGLDAGLVNRIARHANAAVHERPELGRAVEAPRVEVRGRRRRRRRAIDQTKLAGQARVGGLVLDEVPWGPVEALGGEQEVDGGVVKLPGPCLGERLREDPVQRPGRVHKAPNDALEGVPGRARAEDLAAVFEVQVEQAGGGDAGGHRRAQNRSSGGSGDEGKRLPRRPAGDLFELHQGADGNDAPNAPSIDGQQNSTCHTGISIGVALRGTRTSLWLWC